MSNNIEVRVEAIIWSNDKKLLLANHQKNDNSYWVLPGGHVKFCEGLEAALKRELTEEFNISNFEINELVFVDEYIDLNKRHVIKIAFEVKLQEFEENIEVTSNNESIKDARYFSKNELIESNDIFYPSKEFFLKLMELENA